MSLSIIKILIDDRLKRIDTKNFHDKDTIYVEALYQLYNIYKDTFGDIFGNDNINNEILLSIKSNIDLKIEGIENSIHIENVYNLIRMYQGYNDNFIKVIGR